MLNAYTGTANIAALCHEYTGSAKYHTGIDLSANGTSSPVQKLVLQAGQLIAQPERTGRGLTAALNTVIVDLRNIWTILIQILSSGSV